MRTSFTFNNALFVWTEWDTFTQTSRFREVLFLQSRSLMQHFLLAVANEKGLNDPHEAIVKIPPDYVLGQTSRKAFVDLLDFIEKHQAYAVFLRLMCL